MLFNVLIVESWFYIVMHLLYALLQPEKGKRICSDDNSKIKWICKTNLLETICYVTLSCILFLSLVFWQRKKKSWQLRGKKLFFLIEIRTKKICFLRLHEFSICISIGFYWRKNKSYEIDQNVNRNSRIKHFQFTSHIYNSQRPWHKTFDVYFLCVSSRLFDFNFSIKWYFSIYLSMA